MRLSAYIARVLLVAALTPGLVAAQARWTLSTEPSLTIGTGDAAGHELYQVEGATRLTDGRIAVTNAGTSEVRFFSADGAFLGSAGGKGPGPAEFQSIISSARISGDTILVYSLPAAVSVVAPSMQITHKAPLDASKLWVTCRAVERGASLSPAGAFTIQAEESANNPSCARDPGGIRQHTDLLARFDYRAGRFDTLGIFPGTDRDGIRHAAYGRALAVAASADRIFAGETGGDTIIVFSANGRHIGTWRHPWERHRLTRAAREYTPGPVRMPDGSIRAREPYTMPEHYPRFARLMADLAGNLWVMAYPHLDEPVPAPRLKIANDHFVPEDGAQWIVLGPTGDAIATVHTPPRFYVLEIGADYVLGVVLDSLDVERIEMYGLSKSSMDKYGQGNQRVFGIT